MPKPIINIADIQLQPRPPAFAAQGAAAERYDARMGIVGAQIGAKKLGYNITAVPPGKRGFPLHNHQVNEEMFFILEGSGELQMGSETFPVRAGDFIACPPGGQDSAHQIINTGQVELKYLAVSTKLSPEIVEYPNSKKFGIMAEMAAAAGTQPRMLRFVGREGDSVDYWEGE